MIIPENINTRDQLLRDSDTGAVVGIRSHTGAADLLPLQAWQASKTYDPPMISAGTQGISLSAAVTAANTVTVVFRNGTAGDIDLASGILSVTVLRMPR